MPSDRRISPIFALAGLIAALGPASFARAGEGETGEQIYRRQCVACHGDAGRGTPDYPRPLEGDKTPAQLARLIAKTMPEDDPGTCTGDDARKVAEFIHDSFYSKAAKDKPRIEVSRLTVRQYRNTVTDLIGSFRNTGTWDDRRGLHAQYYKSRRFQNNDRVIDRVDPEVHFDFGTEAPDPEKFEPSQFSIRWEGSVLAPESGEYEFIVRTEHAMRLWVNNLRVPLIDATVKSGNDNEYRATIPMLAGRVYPLRLEFSKAKQGVDDSKDKKKRPPKPVKASISLEWRVPNRTPEVIPARNLTPNVFPESFVLETPFPPDDRSVGYERGTTVSKAWDLATTDAAIEVAGYVAGRLRELSGAPESGPDREKKLKEFSHRFAERAFRRPLTDEQKAAYVDRQFSEAKDAETAVKRVVLLVLKSPRFLYREIGGDGRDAYDVASRISYGLWDSLPDKPLLDAAAANALKTREQVAKQAERMVDDLRTRAKVRAFFLQWLRVEQAPEIGKDPEKFPGFDAEVVSDLRTSLDLMLEDVIWGPASDFRQLLLSDDVYLNGRLAGYYGVEMMPDAPFERFSLDSARRAGVLTHPYLLATFAYTATSSPIHRGVFVMRSVLGRNLKPPPEAVAPLAPDLHAGLTTREKVSLQTSPASCMTCHGMVNPLGFALENFDAVGRYRAEEKGKPIDATGSLETRSGEVVSFNGARELASLLAGDEETHAAFVEQMFHCLVKQPIRAYGSHLLPDLRGQFAHENFSIRRLMVEIIADTALTAPERQPDLLGRRGGDR